MPNDSAESTSATKTGATTNGRHSPFGDADGPEALAQWISGKQWADELDVDPESAIGDVLGADTWKAVRKFCRKYEIPMYAFEDGGMAFCDFDAVPREIWHSTASPTVTLTRGQVAEFADDTLTDDPHTHGAELKRKRRQRFDERNRTAQALQTEKIAAGTPYTLDAVAVVAGAEVADAARALIERANRRAWDTPKPHDYREHGYLITAGELFGTLGVAAEVIATMTEATEDDRDNALDELAAARIRHSDDIRRRARFGDIAPLDVAADVLTVSQLATLTPVTPLIEGLLAREQLAELVGAPGSGKTFAAVSMACAVGTGRRWCGHAVPAATPVVLVAAEGATGVHARILAWCEINRVDPAELENKLFVIPRAVQMYDPDHMAQIRALIHSKDAGLAIFDTRARCTVGLEENSATEQGRAIACADEINQQTSAAVLVVHHSAANTDRSRGSTAWDGGVWTSLRLKRGGGKKSPRKVEITCAKHKEWPDGCTHEYMVRQHTVSADLMPKATTVQRSTLVVCGIDPAAAAAAAGAEAEAAMSETAREILSLVAEYGGGDGLTKAEIVRFAAERDIKSRSTVYRAITELHDRRGEDSEKLVKVAGTQKFAVAHRVTTETEGSADNRVTVVGSERYTEAVNALITKLCSLKDEGRINDETTKTEAHKLAGGHAVPFAEAWTRWKAAGRPTDPEQVDKLKSEQGDKGTS